MNGMTVLAKVLIGTGLLLLLGGALLLLAAKLGGSGFRLPGDVVVRRENLTFYFPLATCILASILLTILLNLFLRR